jgi:hypothetical protein
MRKTVEDAARDLAVIGTDVGQTGERLRRTPDVYDAELRIIDLAHRLMAVRTALGAYRVEGSAAVSEALEGFVGAES